MSKITEFLKLMPTAVKNLDKIGEGVINNLLLENDKLPEDEKTEILRRREICKACPYLSTSAINNPALNYRTSREDEHCIQCGCPIATKTAALSANCGLENYNHKNPNHQLPLKWVAYQKPKTENEQTN